MWYKLQPMLRRNVSVAVLVILGLQLLGGMVFAPACPDPCPDDQQGTKCPPMCALCTSCIHALTGIVQQQPTVRPTMSTRRFVPRQPLSTPSQREDDIFHVPLLG
jgi:hypothetical protein